MAIATNWTFEFQQQPGLIYLNHAAVAPWPYRTVEAVTLFAKQNLSQGALDYPAWLEKEKTLREQLRSLINAPQADDIALLKNTSEGLSFIASGLPWKPGDNVVISDQEFPSNRIVWEALASQGVTVRRVALSGPQSPEEALLNACDNNTRLMAISSVQYASGLRMNLQQLGDYCKAEKVYFCVDAIQSLGALPLDVQAIQADFLTADAHKWLLGPEGIALFYVAPRHRESLRLTEFGWHMVEHLGDYERLDWSPAKTARRFECGSPNMLGIHAFSASVSLLHEVGITMIADRVLANTTILMEALDSSRALRVTSPRSADRRSGIVNFTAAGIPGSVLVERLREAGVVCAARGGGVRFSPHFYNEQGQLLKAVELTDWIVSTA